MCYFNDGYEYAEHRSLLYYDVIMQLSSTIVDVYLFYVDIQI